MSSLYTYYLASENKDEFLFNKGVSTSWERTLKVEMNYFYLMYLECQFRKWDTCFNLIKEKYLQSLQKDF